MQLRGHVVTDDRQRVGIVSAVETTMVTPPAVEKRAYSQVTGRPVRYEHTDGTPVMVTPDPVPVETVTVQWEDGSASQLTETVDQWEVLGDVKWIHASETDADMIAVKDRIVDRALEDVGAYAVELRAAPAYPVADQSGRGEDIVIVVQDGVPGDDDSQHAIT